MKLKVCKECGTLIGKDRKSGHYWCPYCKEVRNEFENKLRIVVMGKSGGKKIGKFNFINCMARELRKLGHEVIALSVDELYGIVPQHDFENCFNFKKPINIKSIQYQHDPDFIYIEQMYYRLDVSEITCPVIYQHREYTHFPDIIGPDILLASYHWRMRTYEYYHPWEYHNIPYKDYLCVALDPDDIKPIEKKTIAGISHIGLVIPMWQFRQANGPFADMVMEGQENFWNECVDEGYVNNIPTGLNNDEFHKMLGRCEAILYDAGRFGAFSRRMIEAMGSKTLCVVKIHSNLEKQIYKDMGLTDEMCFFVETVEDVGKISFTEEERKTMADKAYEWITNNHTYEVRVKKLLEILDEFNDGKKKDLKFMGWSLKHKLVGWKEGVVEFD